MTTVDQPTSAEGRIIPTPADGLATARQRFAGPATYLLVVVIQLLVFWPLATKRALDGDEGFYAMAAKLVAHGQEPYFDFWFQYPPGLPYVYGTWTRFTGDSFESLRALSVVLTVALGVILYAHIARRFSRRLGVVAVVLYSTSGLLFSWYSTYKSYVLSVLLLFVAYVLVAASDRDRVCSAARWFAAGAFLGLSIDVRLFFVALVPVFAYYAIDRTASRAKRFAKIVPLLGGLVVGLLPSIYFFVRGPRLFVSDVLFSHTTRSDLSLLDSLVQRLRTMGLLLGEAQFLILIAAAVVLGVFLVVTRRRPPLAVAMALALAVASLIPNPTYNQYFSALVPFLVVGAIELWHTLRATILRPQDRRLKLAIRSIGVTGLLLYVAAGAGAFDSVINTGDGLLTGQAVRSISEEIDARTRAGEVVISFSPRNLYESHAEPLPGLESDFGTFVATNLNLSEAGASRRKLVTIERLEQIVRSGEIRTVVFQDGAWVLFPRPWPRILSDSGYRPVATVLDQTIYQRPDR